MKKACLILTTVLFGYTASAQTDVQNSLLRFPSGGNPTPTYIQEGWGLNISGTNVQPVKVINTSLMVGYTSANQDFGVGNLLINGKVGVGTQSPRAKLHIQDGGMVIGTNAVINDNNGSLSIGSITDNYTPSTGNWFNSGSTLLLSGLDYTTIGFHDSDERVDFIRSGHGTIQLGYNGGWGQPNIGLPNGIWNSVGNVGIGTTSPTAKLDVNGDIAMQHYGYVSSQRNSNNGFTNLFLGGAIKDNGNGTFTVVGDGGSNYFSAIRMDNGATNFGSINFYNGTATSGADYTLSNNDLAGYMKMTINGNAVGIGTNTPDQAYKLSVNGNIRAKEVKVETGWSDYVFKKGYRLKTLPEVEAYIAKQGHLPDVPSEAEVKKNGVNLGETESLLLKKIEELTLYLIEKDKELKAQVSNLKLQSLKNDEMELRLAKLEALLAKPSSKN